MFQRIVVAVDGSESAARAVTLAGTLGAANGAEVTVVHAYDPVPSWYGAPNFESRLRRELDWSERIAAHAEQGLRALGVERVEQDILEGPAATAIVAVAVARHADLVVMGTRGLAPIQGLLLGSVSERVLGAAPCPVLVAP